MPADIRCRDIDESNKRKMDAVNSAIRVIRERMPYHNLSILDDCLCRHLNLCMRNLVIDQVIAYYSPHFDELFGMKDEEGGEGSVGSPEVRDSVKILSAKLHPETSQCELVATSPEAPLDNMILLEGFPGTGEPNSHELQKSWPVWFSDLDIGLRALTRSRAS